MLHDLELRGPPSLTVMYFRFWPSQHIRAGEIRSLLRNRAEGEKKKNCKGADRHSHGSISGYEGSVARN